mmetsp:Transcript_37961/g.93954  ORF Transcript_37961/g.93954 Transcript_37961/m.93954 type:complete len:204 (+) Transcript_37961:167-778(+)
MSRTPHTKTECPSATRRCVVSTHRITGMPDSLMCHRFVMSFSDVRTYVTHAVSESISQPLTTYTVWSLTPLSCSTSLERLFCLHHCSTAAYELSAASLSRPFASPLRFSYPRYRLSASAPGLESSARIRSGGRSKWSRAWCTSSSGVFESEAGQHLAFIASESAFFPVYTSCSVCTPASSSVHVPSACSITLHMNGQAPFSWP